MKTNFLIRNALPRGSGVLLKMVVTVTVLLYSHLMAYAQPVQTLPVNGAVGVTLPVTLEWITASTQDIDVDIFRSLGGGAFEHVYNITLPGGTTYHLVPVEDQGVNYINNLYFWSINDGITSSESLFTTIDEDDCSNTEMQSCDDNDPCTTNDGIAVTLIANSNEICGSCTGTIIGDTDGDGICDSQDTCPDFDNNLIGTPCDDGDDCTINDVYTTNCECIGGLQPHPIIEFPSPTNGFIESVVLNGRENSSGYDSGYGDYTIDATGNVFATLNSGNSNVITLIPGASFSSPYPENWGIWIDFNGNSIFEDSEQVYTGLGTDLMTPVNGTFSADLGMGTVTMRVGMVWNDELEPCGEFLFGEFEDYTVAMCPGDSDGDGICNTNDSCYGTSSDQDGDYICDDEDICPQDPANSCIGDYCSPEVYRSAERSFPVAITSVVLNGNENLSGYDGGYGDYTNTVLAGVGDMNSISITPNDANMRYGVWIDFNKDGDFDDVGDEVFNSINSLTEFSFEFSAPPGVGTTTMRVVVTGDSYPSPCGTLYAAEVEDYTVALSADCPPYLTVYDFDVPGDYNASDFTQTDDAPGAVVTVNTAEHLELSGANRVRLNNGFRVDFDASLRADNEDCQ